MSIDRSSFIQASSEAAEEAVNSFFGGPLTIDKGKKKYLRFMPAYTVRDGRGIWFSVANRHYSVPLARSASGEGKSVTYDCPQSIGARCLTCEHKEDFKQLGVWSGGRGGCKPSRRIRYNVIDAENPKKGVIVFEDGTTTLKLLKNLLARKPNLFDPFEGSVLVVENTGEENVWREIWEPEGGQVSLDELHPDALEWALPDNLPDLDESWEFPTYEQQVQMFMGVDPSVRVLTVGQESPALTQGDDVVDGEIVNEEETESQEQARPWKGSEGSEPEKKETAPAQKPWENSESSQEDKPQPRKSTGNSGLLKKFQQKVEESAGEDE